MPPALSSGERKGEDTGSREEMGAFFTTEGEPETDEAGEAPGEGVGAGEEDGSDTAFAALASKKAGMGFSSKSMSSKSSSFTGAGGEGVVAGRGSERDRLTLPSVWHSLAIRQRSVGVPPRRSEAVTPSCRKWAWLDRPRPLSNRESHTSHFRCWAKARQRTEKSLRIFFSTL